MLGLAKAHLHSDTLPVTTASTSTAGQAPVLTAEAPYEKRVGGGERSTGANTEQYL